MNEKMFWKKFVLLSLCCIISLSGLLAHKPDQTYLYLRIFKDRIDGTVEITLKDINIALNLGIDPAAYKPSSEEDEVKTPAPESLLKHRAIIEAYILEKVAIASKQFGAHQIKFINPSILPLDQGIFYLADFELQNIAEIPDNLDIRYEILLDEDPIQKGFLIVGHNWKAGVVNNESLSSLTFSQSDREQTFDLGDASIWKGIKQMIWQGMWHIWIGLDHILFLLALLLPAVVTRKPDYKITDFANGWQPVGEFKSAFFYILKIVTLFTIAHSITLSLAAVGVLDLSARIVESIIAFSIGLAAFFNIKYLIKRSESLIAFGFGLFHGMGFASVLGEKGLADDYMLYSLVGFNVGVEIGQLLIIIILFPILFLLRKTKAYPWIIFIGSLLLIWIAMHWSIERFFEIDFSYDDWLVTKLRRGLLFLGFTEKHAVVQWFL